MHPVLTQAIAAERAREQQAHAAAARLAREARGSRRARLLARLPRGSRGPVLRPAGRQLRAARQPEICA
jgi:hypothetical protein